MAKTIHTVTLPNGKVAKRVSENRTYPFVVVGQPSKDGALRRAKLTDGDKSHFRYLKASASVQPGEKYPEAGYSFPVSEKAHNEGVAMLAETPDLDSYVAACVARRVAGVEASIAAGDYDRWEALAWSSRRDLAEKQVSAFSGHVNVRVMETTREIKEGRKA